MNTASGEAAKLSVLTCGRTKKFSLASYFPPTRAFIQFLHRLVRNRIRTPPELTMLLNHRLKLDARTWAFVPEPIVFSEDGSHGENAKGANTEVTCDIVRR